MSAAAWLFVFFVAISPLILANTVLATSAVRAVQFALRTGRRFGHGYVMNAATVAGGAFLAFATLMLFPSDFALLFQAIGLLLGIAAIGVGLSGSVALSVKRLRCRLQW